MLAVTPGTGETEYLVEESLEGLFFAWNWVRSPKGLSVSRVCEEQPSVLKSASRDVWRAIHLTARVCQILLVAYLTNALHLPPGDYDIESGKVVSIFPTRQLNLCEPGYPVISTFSPVLTEVLPFSPKRLLIAYIQTSSARSATPSEALSGVPFRSGLSAVSERLWFGRTDMVPVQDAYILGN